MSFHTNQYHDINHQYCWSGDNTMEAIELATEKAAKDSNPETTENFVFVFSDANFNRYGISGKALGKAMLSKPNVKVFVIFIGGGREAESVIRQLPKGQSFVCMDTSTIPQAFKNLFAAHLLK